MIFAARCRGLGSLRAARRARIICGMQRRHPKGGPEGGRFREGPCAELPSEARPMAPDLPGARIEGTGIAAAVFAEAEAAGPARSAPPEGSTPRWYWDRLTGPEMEAWEERIDAVESLSSDTPLMDSLPPVSAAAVRAAAGSVHDSEIQQALRGMTMDELAEHMKDRPARARPVDPSRPSGPTEIYAQAVNDRTLHDSLRAEYTAEYKAEREAERGGSSDKQRTWRQGFIDGGTSRLDGGPAETSEGTPDYRAGWKLGYRE